MIWFTTPHSLSKKALDMWLRWTESLIRPGTAIYVSSRFSPHWRRSFALSGKNIRFFRELPVHFCNNWKQKHKTFILHYFYWIPKIRTLEVYLPDLLSSDNRSSWSPILVLLQFRKPECNNTDINYTEYNHTESIISILHKKILSTPVNRLQSFWRK